MSMEGRQDLGFKPFFHPISARFLHENRLASWDFRIHERRHLTSTEGQHRISTGLRRALSRVALTPKSEVLPIPYSLSPPQDLFSNPQLDPT